MATGESPYSYLERWNSQSSKKFNFLCIEPIISNHTIHRWSLSWFSFHLSTSQFQPTNRCPPLAIFICPKQPILATTPFQPTPLKLKSRWVHLVRHHSWLCPHLHQDWNFHRPEKCSSTSLSAPSQSTSTLSSLSSTASKGAGIRIDL